MIWNFLKRLFGKKIDYVSPKEVATLDSVKYPKHYEIALKELGVSEIVGKKHNSRILEYHKATSLQASDDETAWCSSFVNWCLKGAGIAGTNKANARSFLNWGSVVSEPKTGDVVVFWRGKKDGWQGHVAFYVSHDSKYITVLGGNQSNKVCYAKYPASQLLGYRRL